MAMQVESLTAARKACQAGTEPSDAIRVVNAVLTQLDQIKRSESSLKPLQSSRFIFMISLNVSQRSNLCLVLTGGLILQVSQRGHPDDVQRD